MALRIRSNGTIVCAAMHPPREGDAYIPDDLSYEMTVVHRVVVTEPMILPPGVGLGGHAAHGVWWWRGQEPDRAVIEMH